MTNTIIELKGRSMVASSAEKLSCFSFHNSKKIYKVSFLHSIFVFMCLLQRQRKKINKAIRTVDLKTRRIFNKLSNENIQPKGVAEQ